jgi:ABC-2 type transport system permease protein
MVIFTVVFKLFLGVSVQPGNPSGMDIFAFFLLCGLLPWNLLANGIGGSMGVLIGNSNLIKKTYFPREVLVAANVAAWVVSLLIEVGVLSVALMVAGNFVLPWLPLVLVLVVVQTVFVMGIALTLSALNVYFRDVQHLIGIVLQLWFYATPIVYPLSRVPARASLFGVSIPVRRIYGLNPMVRFVEAYRDCLYNLRFPSAKTFGYLVLVAAASLASGLYAFARLEPKLAEEL